MSDKRPSPHYEKVVYGPAMKALSIKQPWAYLIAAGIKDVENRSWSTNYRGRIYIHASKSKTDMCKEVIAYILRRLSGKWGGEFMLEYPRLYFGGIIGEVDIVACVSPREYETYTRIKPSSWFEGPYGFVLANAVMYDEPIPYRGQQGLFEVRLP